MTIRRSRLSQNVPARDPTPRERPSLSRQRSTARVMAVCGIRALHPDSEPEVELAVAQEIGDGATELRFGDAAGTDQVALGAACIVGAADVTLRAFVVGNAGSVPRSRRPLIESCADVVYLGLRPGAKWAYERQAEALLDGADRLLAFTDGRTHGGTWDAIQKARRAGIEVEVVQVLSTDAPDLTTSSLVVVSPT